MPHQPLSLLAGATRGIGLALARQLATRGCHLVLVHRSSGTEVAAARELEQLGATVELLHADLSEIDEVHALARRFRATHDRLDLLVQSADILLRTPQVNARGIDRAFTAKYLSRFILAQELGDLI